MRSYNTLGFFLFASISGGWAQQQRPNILFVISDDQSYPYASVYGSKMVETPAFDWVAKNGCLFTNAFVTSPGSSPSRASILTGKYPWQIAEAGTHFSDFPVEYVCFPDMLKDAGYKIGCTGKGWGPGNSGKRPYNPAGPGYNKAKLKPPYSGISNIDYAENFRLFMEEKVDGEPFYFWYGATEPHRDFEQNAWKKEGKSLEQAEVPGFLPESDVIKGDLLDYAVEIEWFDAHLQKMLELLREKGELENTIIVVTADNGMAFPSAKANCFEFGTHVPLAIYWGKEIPANLVVEEVTSTVDLAPTLLEAAGVKRTVYKGMSGKSMLSVLKGKAKRKEAVAFSGRERHGSARYDNWGYPVRAMRTGEYLYIRNFHPERWPAGDPCRLNPDGSMGEMHNGYGDIDPCPSKTFLIENRNNPLVYPYFLKAVSKRPYEELYRIVGDPACLENLVGKSDYAAVLKKMRNELDKMMKETKDTRNVMVGDKELWETYPRRADIKKFPKPLF